MFESPSSKLVTVFGGSGFLGRHVVRALAKDGWRIRVAVRNPATAHFLAPMGRVGQIQIVKGNIRNDESVRAALHRADAAVNLVGILYESGQHTFQAIHADAVMRMARIASEEGVERLLHVSALGADAQSTSRYARSKAEGEAWVRKLFPKAVIFRPSVVFGPEDDFFNKFAWLARLSPALPLIGGGNTRFQPVYAGDVARAAAKVLADPAVQAETYELGGPEIMTFRQILDLVLRETRRKPILVPVPFVLAKAKALFLGLLPKPLLTVDQVRLLESDSVVGEGHSTFRDLGIAPVAAQAILPSYLWRFRPKGQFEVMASAGHGLRPNVPQ